MLYPFLNNQALWLKPAIANEESQFIAYDKKNNKVAHTHPYASDIFQRFIYTYENHLFTFITKDEALHAYTYNGNKVQELSLPQLKVEDYLEQASRTDQGTIYVLAKDEVGQSVAVAIKGDKVATINLQDILQLPTLTDVAFSVFTDLPIIEAKNYEGESFIYGFSFDASFQAKKASATSFEGIAEVEAQLYHQGITIEQESNDIVALNVLSNTATKIPLPIYFPKVMPLNTKNYLVVGQANFQADGQIKAMIISATGDRIKEIPEASTLFGSYKESNISANIMDDTLYIASESRAATIHLQTDEIMIFTDKDRQHYFETQMNDNTKEIAQLESDGKSWSWYKFKTFLFHETRGQILLVNVGVFVFIISIVLFAATINYRRTKEAQYQEAIMVEAVVTDVISPERTHLPYKITVNFTYDNVLLEGMVDLMPEEHFVPDIGEHIMIAYHPTSKKIFLVT